MMDITRLNRRDILNYQRRRTEARESAIIPFYKLEERRNSSNRGRQESIHSQPGQVIILSERVADFDFSPGVA